MSVDDIRNEIFEIIDSQFPAPGTKMAGDITAAEAGKHWGVTKDCARGRLDSLVNKGILKRVSVWDPNTSKITLVYRKVAEKEE